MAAEPEPAVVEFGEDDDGRVDEPRRGFLRALATDPRLVLVCAGLAALAAFGSLIGEWITIRMPGDLGGGGDASFELRNGVNGAGVLGSTYLIGVLLLAALLMTVIAGPASARRTARVAGLGVAGVTLAVLIAVRTTSREFAQGYFFGPEEPPDVSFGRGLTMAYAAVLLAGLALVLAGRLTARARPAVEPAGDGTADARPLLVDWAWRRPRSGGHDREELGTPEPLDLTVKPATPFAHPDPSTER